MGTCIGNVIALGLKGNEHWKDRISLSFEATDPPVGPLESYDPSARIYMP